MIPKHIHEWDFWDWGGILHTALFLGSFVFVIAAFILGPEEVMKMRLKGLDKETAATVTGYKELYSRNKSGSVHLYGVTINYSYIVEATPYQGVEMIPDDREYKELLDAVHSYSNLLIHIKYSSKNPSNSLIDVYSPLVSDN